jgi:hypothetical protein
MQVPDILSPHCQISQQFVQVGTVLMYAKGIMDMKLLGTFRDCANSLEIATLVLSVSYCPFFDLWTDNLSVDTIVTVFFFVLRSMWIDYCGYRVSKNECMWYIQYVVDCLGSTLFGQF